MPTCSEAETERKVTRKALTSRWKQDSSSGRRWARPSLPVPSRDALGGAVAAAGSAVVSPGRRLGLFVRLFDGPFVAPLVGPLVGLLVGPFVGPLVGPAVGSTVVSHGDAGSGCSSCFLSAARRATRRIARRTDARTARRAACRTDARTTRRTARRAARRTDARTARRTARQAARRTDARTVRRTARRRRRTRRGHSRSTTPAPRPRRPSVPSSLVCGPSSSSSRNEARVATKWLRQLRTFQRVRRLIFKVYDGTVEAWDLTETKNEFTDKIGDTSRKRSISAFHRSIVRLLERRRREVIY